MKRCVRLAALALCVGFLGIGRATAAEALKVRQATPAEVGKKALCPVMNINFEVAKGTQVIDYKGKSYYFCCENCVQEFQKDPDKFAMK